MPTSIIHLKVGYEYAKKYKQYDNKQFYLGLIAPDAVNLNGFAEKEKRWNAHIRDKDLDIWKSNITNFYRQNKNDFDNNYIYGYLIHVLTDIYFDEKNPTKLFPKIQNEVGHEKVREEYSKQMDLYERSQLTTEWWKYVESKLKNSEAETINNIEKEYIEKWKELILKDYSEKRKTQYELITPEYIDEIVAELEKYIQKINL
ncbi:MAG: hypothetical protein HFJ47_01145 [Clostridia bacterium]|nr:hypothetical protein [Clostridia bacterium]